MSSIRALFCSNIRVCMLDHCDREMSHDDLRDSVKQWFQEVKQSFQDREPPRKPKQRQNRDISAILFTDDSQLVE